MFLNIDFKDFIQALNSNKVEYLLVGGYAVIFYGYNRTTGGIDIWVRKSKANYKKLVQAFTDFGMPVFDMTLANFLNNELIDVFSFGNPPIKIDLMTAVKGLEFEDCFENKKTEVIDDVQINIIDLEDLIQAKKAANRSKDQDDIENLT